MKKLLLSTSMSDRINYDDAVKRWGAECARHAEDSRLTNKLINAYYAASDIDTDDTAEARARFRVAFRQGWKAQKAQKSASAKDVFLMLNENSCGKRFWRMCGDPDHAKLSETDGRTLAVLGPATMGPDGYSDENDAAEALATVYDIQLHNPATWPETDYD